jgi:hypothetical protein
LAQQAGVLMKREYALYRLVVRGELDGRYAYLFEGMQLERTEGTTLIFGPVRDQAQLHGLIERTEELGLELISVQQVATSRPDSESERDEA